MNTTDAMMESTEMTDPDELHPIDPSPPGGFPPPPPPIPPTADGAFPPPTPPAPNERTSWWHRPVSRVSRRDGGGRVGGVVGGLARAYGFDVRTSRIAVLVALFVVPIIPVLYLVLWILLPPTPEEAVPLDLVIRDRRRMPLIVVLGIVVVASGFGSLGPWSGSFRPWVAFGGYSWGLALIGIGVLLWMSPSLFGPSSRQTGAMNGVNGTTTAVGGANGAAPTAPRRRRRPIGLISIGIAALFVAAAAALEAVNAWHPKVVAVTMIAVAIAIVGLAVSALFNRSILGVPLLLILGAALSFLAIARPQLEGGLGERTVVVSNQLETAHAERLAAGRLTIDLRAATVETFRLDAVVGLGRLDVIVPHNATLRLHTDVGAGSVQLDGTVLTDGVRTVDQRDVLPAKSEGASPTVELTLKVGAGLITITHAG